MGGVKKRLDDLEGLASTKASESEGDKRLRIERAITRLILDEFARLKRSGEGGRFAGDLLERAVRGVVEDQYSDLGQDNCRYIADGWIGTIHNWTRFDWMLVAGREGPPK